MKWKNCKVSVSRAFFGDYSERATNSVNPDEYNKELAEKNLATIRENIMDTKIKELWDVWGNLNQKSLRDGKNDILSLFKELNVKVFGFHEPTKRGEPKNPTQRGNQLETTLQNKGSYKF
ncbi:MAG: DUF1643 domain-containing protein [Anaerotignum sp.]|nr:DUF1643 domain-containing protein [Anaerotignum sp.]